MLIRLALHRPLRTSPALARGLAVDNATGRRWGEARSAPKLMKRKVAIVGGYLGSGYHGLQLNQDVPTIENDLRGAILRAGAMRESNFEDLGKIDWARSSRTDKGVHAGCIVFSGKLLIDEDKVVDPATGRVNGLTEALNAELPDNIRIFSCTRVNKRFSARKNCVLREYEYFMPLSFLKESIVEADKTTAEELDVDEAAAEFCRALRRYEGVHDFHNFTRSRSYFYKVQAKKDMLKAHRDADNMDGDEVNDQIEETNNVEDDDEVVESDDSDFVEDVSQFIDEEGLTRKLLARHRRSIYSCRGSLVSDFCGKPFLRVHIVGQAFLLNQIRCMIGGALAVATKSMTRTAFDAALSTNRIVRVPIAPAEGLVLLSSTFGGKLHTVSLYEDPNTALAKERKDLIHRVLLDRHEDSKMTKFREEVIYPEVAATWNMDGKIDRWRAYLERCYEANQRLDEDDLSSLLYELDQAMEMKKKRSQSFVRQNRIDVADKGRGGALLPRQFTTKLCVRYNVAPGIFTSDLRRAVAQHLKIGKISLDADENEIMAYIDNCGAAMLAEEGRKLRLSIRT